MQADNDKTEVAYTDVIKNILANLPGLPGVYRMLNADGKIIYIGKAKNLKKRVSSYFQKTQHDIKTQVLVRQIRNIETIVTHTEAEALLLESNLIKEHRPRYNVIYRDDKSYPYIYVSLEQEFPRLSFHRGALKGKGRYFGPYPSSGAVRETLIMLQKVFSVRQCSESFYKNRSRPCLQYQIKRCTAPCVGLVEKTDYAREVKQVVMFLEGRNHQLVEMLAGQMEQASAQLDYEKAAILRDKIANLRRISEKQFITDGEGDYDVIAAELDNGLGCVQLFSIRNGQNLGNKAYFPHRAQNDTPSEMLYAFLSQHYLQKGRARKNSIPATILLSEAVEDSELLAELISEQCAKKIEIRYNVRGTRARWLAMAAQNARIAIKARQATHATVQKRFAKLQQALQLDEMPARLECFDISHTMGEATVASCVVFGLEGPIKSDYRRYNIEGITPGDDYAAMQQALLRRYRKAQDDTARLPDILFIDGGKGQVSQARQVFEELQIANVMLMGVAKGPTRKAGLETLILAGNLSGQDSEFILPSDSPALHLIQQVRDEAHRFAISGHRQRRGKKRSRSVLEDIEGLGPRRRQQLLTRFGGLQEIARAGVEDLASVHGISKQLAQKIYDSFHSDS